MLKAVPPDVPMLPPPSANVPVAFVRFTPFVVLPAELMVVKLRLRLVPAITSSAVPAAAVKLPPEAVKFEELAIKSAVPAPLLIPSELKLIAPVLPEKETAGPAAPTRVKPDAPMVPPKVEVVTER